MEEVKKILVFGNILVREDSTPIKLIPELQKYFSLKEVKFIEADPTEEIKEYGPELSIIDSVLDIKDVRELVLKKKEDFERLELSKNMSMHDFDLGFNLRLLKKTGFIQSARIVCVPVKIEDEKEVLEKIKKIVEGWRIR